MIPRRRIPFILAAGVGLLFALLARFVLGSWLFNDSGGLLTWSFLLLMPLALGALTAHFIPRGGSKWWRLLWGPSLNVLLFITTALLFHLEGLICVIMIGPLFMVMAAAGALVYSVIADPHAAKHDKTLVVAAFALLPFVAAPIERQFDNPDDFRRVENALVINAPAATVWQHIIRVAPISPAELGGSVVDDIGFPRPVAATLSREGVGGVRHATFERGVEFIETIDEWVPLRRISFRIVPNTATIPPTTFDEHVLVGGQYFDVLRGTYELRPAGPGRTRLVLFSQQRLSTHFNPYAGLWTDFVMREIQRRILAVIKQRCEKPSVATR